MQICIIFDLSQIFVYNTLKFIEVKIEKKNCFETSQNSLPYKSLKNVTFTFKVDLRVNMKSRVYFCHIIIWSERILNFSCEVIRDWPLSRNKWAIFTKVKVTIKMFVGIDNIRYLQHFMFSKLLKILYTLKSRRILPWPLSLASGRVRDMKQLCHKTRIWKQNCKISASFGVIKGCIYVLYMYVHTYWRTDQVVLKRNFVPKNHLWAVLI